MAQTVSVAMATWNGEKIIRYCLDAVKDWTEDIVIIDSSSTDKTVEIVKEYTQNVRIEENRPMIHTNKNMAIDAVKSDWVLNLDQDEVITPELRDEILQVINSNPKENGFWIARSNYFFGHFMRKGGQYPDYTIRLYRRGKGRLAEKSIHEQATIDGEVGYLKNPMVHLTYPSLTQYLTRYNRYTTLIALEMVDANVPLSAMSMIKYFALLPAKEFFLIYLRHKGFVDGMAGFIFAFLSATRYIFAYEKYWERKRTPEHDLKPADWQ